MLKGHNGMCTYMQNSDIFTLRTVLHATAQMILRITTSQSFPKKNLVFYESLKRKEVKRLVLIRVIWAWYEEDMMVICTGCFFKVPNWKIHQSYIFELIILFLGLIHSKILAQHGKIRKIWTVFVCGTLSGSKVQSWYRLLSFFGIFERSLMIVV